LRVNINAGWYKALPGAGHVTARPPTRHGGKQIIFRFFHIMIQAL
jgi:hypothetical protein